MSVGGEACLESEKHANLPAVAAHELHVLLIGQRIHFLVGECASQLDSVLISGIF